jgi:hypothetical protein
MGKQRREQSQDSIFVDNPFVDGFLEWMGSREAGNVRLHRNRWPPRFSVPRSLIPRSRPARYSAAARPSPAIMSLRTSLANPSASYSPAFETTTILSGCRSFNSGRRRRRCTAQLLW